MVENEDSILRGPTFRIHTNKKYLKANPIKPQGEILLLAGDTIPFVEIEKENDFFNFHSDSFGHAYLDSWQSLVPPYQLQS